MGAIGPSPDEVFTTWPSWPDSIIRGTKVKMPFTTPVTLTPKTQDQSFRVVCQTLELGAPTPALLHRRWQAPNRSYTVSASAPTDAALVTSVAWIRTSGWPVNSFSTSSSAAGSTSAMATRMPSARKLRTRARPMPFAPPVTTATLSLRSFIRCPPVVPRASRAEASARTWVPLMAVPLILIIDMKTLPSKDGFGCRRRVAEGDR